MREIETTVDLEVDPATAWAVLTDFPAIGDWNPFVRRIDGELVGGWRHVHESEMKEDRRTHGRRHHERRPQPGS